MDEYSKEDVHNYTNFVTLINGAGSTSMGGGGGSSGIADSMGLGNVLNDGSFEDPTYHLFKNCEDMLDNDPLLGSIFTKQAYALFGKGIMFQTDSGMPIVPDSDNELASAVDQYWKPFLYDSFRFLWIYGFLVVYIYETRSGAKVFAVPDTSKIVVTKMDDIIRGCTVMRAKWICERTRSPLYIFQNGLPFALQGKNYRKSPVESVKPWIAELYALIECRSVMLSNIAKGAIIVEKVQQKTSASKNMQDDLPLTDPVEALYLEGEENKAKTDAFYQSVEQLKQVSLMERLNAVKVPVKPWVRQMVLRNEPPEARYAPIPPGSHGSAISSGTPDLDYLAVMQALENKIRAFFGERPAEVKSKAKVPGSASGGGGDQGGGDKSDAGTPDGNMLFMWREYYCGLMTQLFNILYSNDDIEVCDVKATYKEENERLIDEDAEYEITELLHEIPENQKHQPPPEADGGAINGEVANSLALVPQKKNKEAPKKEEKLKDSSRIRVMLVGHVMSHPDTAKKLVEHGVMTQDSFNRLHPPVARSHEEEDAVQKEIEKVKQQQEALKNEKDKMKQAIKEKKLKDQLQELKTELAQLKTSNPK